MTSIRQATVNDAIVVAQLNRFVHDLHFEQRPDHFRTPGLDELTDWYQLRLAHSDTACWIAEADGTAIGYLLAIYHQRPVTPFSPARNWCEIDQVAIDPSHRRHGIGQALMQAAIAAANGKGIRTIEASSWAFNDDMHRFLGRLGFKRKVIRFELSLDNER
ncbi:MAG TPA: GNAT family N-acetyltransferase [Gemmatimonadaceae bacterium]